MQYVFFEKGLCSVQSWSEPKPQMLGNFRDFFVLKVTLQSVVTEKMGEQDVLVAPQ